MTATQPLWQTIAASIREDIAQGRFVPGSRLPTEAEQAARFGVNRHTVRRALASLAEAGLVHARRGAGVFVTHTPTDYPLGRRVRFHQNIREAGRSPEKRILSTLTRGASGKESAALELPTEARVHVYEGLSFVDGAPVALFRSVFPAARFPDLLAGLSGHNSVTQALREAGVPDYTRRSTRLTAKTADAVQAGHLAITPGAPLLRSVSVSVDPEGRPVEFGSTWFAGERVTLTLDF